jgi:hypothetical protein
MPLKLPGYKLFYPGDLDSRHLQRLWRGDHFFVSSYINKLVVHRFRSLYLLTLIEDSILNIQYSHLIAVNPTLSLLISQIKKAISCELSGR